MKMLVIFGSESDRPVYEPFVNRAKEYYEVTLVIASAHRDPELVEKVVTDSSFDFIVAGAGLAAHLPGVIASKCTTPIFGIPVAANFGGLDALLSIIQMPKGVPVLAVAPGNENEIIKFLNQLIKDGRVDIVLVSKEEEVSSVGCKIHIPNFSKESLNKSSSVLKLEELVKTGGVWVGVNNEKNANIMVSRLLNQINTEKELPCEH